MEPEHDVSHQHADEREHQHRPRVDGPALLVVGVDPRDPVDGPLDGREEAVSRCLATAVGLRHVVAGNGVLMASSSRKTTNSTQFDALMRRRMRGFDANWKPTYERLAHVKEC